MMSLAPNPCSLARVGSGAGVSPSCELRSIASQGRAVVGPTRQSKMTVASAAPAAGSTAPPEVGKRSGTILEAWEEIRNARGGDVKEMPREFLSNAGDGPTLREDEVVEEALIPVIDLSRAETDRAAVAKQLNEAASEWGFFKLVNHGLSLDELREAEAEAFKFFDLSTDTKERLREGGIEPAYVGNNVEQRVSSLHWAESLRLNKGLLDGIVERVWPDGNAKFRNAMMTFMEGSEAINKLLLDLLAEGLGLRTEFFSQHLNERKTLALRLNYYPPCPWPSDCLGTLGHTDGCSITVLYQNSIGGLQIQKDGRWMQVKPVEGSVVVNIGDTLHAWSNGRLRSVVHRAVVNETERRLSLACFMSVDMNLLISAPDELIDESRPRLYRPFKFMDYARHVMTTRHEMSTKFTEKREGQLMLDEFEIDS